MQAPLCFDAATEGATGGLLVLPHPSMQQSEGRAENEKLGDISKTTRPLQNLTPSPLNIVNVYCSVFKAQERVYRLSSVHLRQGTASMTSTSSPLPGSSTTCPMKTTPW